ncbi:MAG: type II secretion system GspH family protein [Actinomycetota bacterium]|nr:type II secretion system GspH family protein [Actinomycetota bacterium]
MVEGRRLRGQAGSTLVELILTIAIMGIAFTTLLGGTFTAVAASDRQRKAVAAETVLASFAEAIKLAPYEVCPATNYEASYTPPAHFSHKMVGCTPLTPPVPDAQLLTLQVASDDGRATEKVQIVKRKTE